MLVNRRDKIYGMLFIGIISLVIPLDFLLHALGATPSSDEWRRHTLVVTPDTLLNGEAGPALEQFLSDQSFLTHGSAAWYRAFTAGYLGRRPQTTFQLDDTFDMDKTTWLFYPERRKEFTRDQRENLERTVVERLTDAVREIEKAGVKIVIQFIPDRSRVYADKAYESGLPPEKARFLPDVVDQLRSAGIAVHDLTAPFAAAIEGGTQVFYRDDHHWTYAGAQLAAKEAGDVLAPLLPAHQKEAPSYEVFWDAHFAHGSSLLRRQGFPKGSEREQLVVDDDEPCARFEPPWEPAHYKSPPQGGLMLLTSSYGLFGSVPFLQNALGQELGWSMREGKGAAFAPSQFIAQILNDPAMPVPSVVLWNIPEYHLYQRLVEGQFRFPEYRRTATETVVWKLGNSTGLHESAPGVHTIASQQATFQILLEEGAKDFRVAISATDLPGFKTLIGPPGETPLILIDDAGPVPYDFRFATPRDLLILNIYNDAPGGSFSIEGVSTWRE